MTPEAAAREKIDKLLVASGWAVQDKKDIDFNASPGIAVREYPTDTGPADYVLFVDKMAVGIVEAKKEEIGQNITTVEDQTAGYGGAKLKWIKNNQPIPFLYESTGKIPPGSFAEPNDPIFTLNRYTLASLDLLAAKQPDSQPRGRAGSEYTSTPNPYVRKATASVVITPEHAVMQAKLVEQLKEEFPNAQILCEENFVDVSVRTDSELLLFEIKSDQEAKSVIRQALGQILEYAYHPARKHTLPLRLVIVGRTPASIGDVKYLEFLKSKFALPISYRTIAL